MFRFKKTYTFFISNKNGKTEIEVDLFSVTSISCWKMTTRPPLSPVASSSPVWLNSTVDMMSAVKTQPYAVRAIHEKRLKTTRPHRVNPNRARLHLSTGGCRTDWQWWLTYFPPLFSPPFRHLCSSWICKPASRTQTRTPFNSLMSSGAEGQCHEQLSETVFVSGALPEAEGKGSHPSEWRTGKLRKSNKIWIWNSKLLLTRMFIWHSYLILVWLFLIMTRLISVNRTQLDKHYSQIN